MVVETLARCERVGNRLADSCIIIAGKRRSVPRPGWKKSGKFTKSSCALGDTCASRGAFSTFKCGIDAAILLRTRVGRAAALGPVELGFEEAMMTVAELARQFLIDAPSDALCDSCLALACGATLVEMRQITTALLGEGTAFHQDATCASCHRTVAAIVYHHT